MRIAMVSLVRLLGEAVAQSLCARDASLDIALVRTIDELGYIAPNNMPFDLVVVDTTQGLDLDAVRNLRRDHPGLPLLALGLREQEAEVLAHGSAGFTCYVRREDGLERLHAMLCDAVAGRLDCSPEIAASMMRALFRNGPVPVPMPDAGGHLTRREEEVAQLVTHALSNKEVARELGLSESTVKHHVHSILGKLGLATRGQLMRRMRADGQSTPPARIAI
ncbi:response regulator transcription factor [Sphingomonas bacterium]|uniref:response regulator transcription factor n=1 Tax=Sphingomonas bacterium TaxID=1895847 RepID=UPI00261FDE98|nr:response regulator transcription factor [Sphingomonas bacterium]MDB5678539.1 response regulator transcription factor [Sphingomonas bacterium]